MIHTSQFNTEVVLHILLDTILSLKVAYILWFLFLFVYWFADKYEKKYSVKKEREIKEINHHGLLMVFIGIAIIIHYTSQHNEWLLSTIATSSLGLSAIRTFGVLMMLIGLHYIIHARLDLGGCWGPHIYVYKNIDDMSLVRTGVYARARHPVFLGQILMTVGTFLISNNSYIFFLPVATLMLNNCRAAKEEQELSRRFGDDFKKYKNKTSRYIPCLKHFFQITH